MENAEPKLFSTRDLGLAATLMSHGFQAVGIDFQFEGNKRTAVGYWSFEDVPEMRRIEQDFWSGSVRLEPRTFLVNMRSLKSQVVGAERAPR